MKVKRLLYTTAAELRYRGAVALSRIVLAEADRFPEADELPDPPETEAGDPDFKVGTSDFSGDLGVPPYRGDK